MAEELNDEVPSLSPEQIARAREYFDAGEVCAHCRGVHVRACPRVKRLKYHPDQTLAEVEFWPHGQWPTDNIIFPDMPEMLNDSLDGPGQ